MENYAACHKNWRRLTESDRDGELSFPEYDAAEWK